MIKTKNSLMFLFGLVVVFIFSLVFVVGAKEIKGQNVNQEINQNQNQNQNASANEDYSQQNNQNLEQENEMEVEQNASSADEDSQSNKGQVNAEQHRSAVANFVQQLLKVADREGGIGQQVRVVAQQQGQSVNTTIQAIEKIQIRSKVKTFLLGTDYKNVGVLRSEIVQTRNRLEQLKRLMEKAQSEIDKTELQNQIKLLEQEQAKIETFLKAQEGKFSLFGWLVKLFQ